MHRFFFWFGMPGTIMLSCLMSLLAWVLAVGFRTKDRIICMIAMFLSTLGDMFMDNFPPVTSRVPLPYFMVGATLFLCAHLVYTTAFWGLIRRKGYPLVNPGFRGAILLVAVCSVPVVIKCLTNDNPDWSLLILCVLYIFAVGTNCAVICSFGWSVHNWHSIVIVGAVSFFLSDLIIGVGTLAGFSTPFLSEMIWWLYPIGQILILIGG